MIFNTKKKKEELFCYECGCFIKYASKKVWVTSSGLHIYNTRNFCGKCSPLYNEIGFKEVYYKYETTGDGSKKNPYLTLKIEVTKEGKPIKK